MENTHIDEQQLLASLQNGEITAFDRIFKKYYPILCAYGRRFVDHEDAKEIAGDAILWLWEHRETLLIDTSLGRYLLKSVYRRSLNCIKQKQLKYTADTNFYEEMESLIQNVDTYQLMELTKRIKEAIDELPASYRETFIQHRFTKMSHKEIAEKLGVSPKTVAYRIQQATKLLRKSLSDFQPMILAFLTSGISS